MPDTSVDNDVLLRAEGIVKHFPIKQGIFFKRTIGNVSAVDGVKFRCAPRRDPGPGR